MSSLRGMRHLLRPRREPPPPEEPRLPRVGTEPQLVGLPLDVSVRDLWRSRLYAVMVDNYAGVPEIRFVEGDILDPELPARVAAELPRGAR
ncbi:MAG TPA: hypothetical protein VFY47_01835 [Thermoleophilaceae bacterium]|nr:hypothetical protein [Thermoleophilaceae bacterium]